MSVRTMLSQGIAQGQPAGLGCKSRWDKKQGARLHKARALGWEAGVPLPPSRLGIHRHGSLHNNHTHTHTHIHTTHKAKVHRRLGYRQAGLLPSPAGWEG